MYWIDVSDPERLYNNLFEQHLMDKNMCGIF